MARRVSWEAPRAVLPNDGKHDPAVPSPTSTTRAVPDGESAAANTENRDIFVDINDRFPPDVLSDFFAKAKDAQSSTPFTDPILSLNMPNYEPKNWSFFRNLAQNEFQHKDRDNLAKIEEGSYPFGRLEHDAFNVKNFPPLDDISVEILPVSSSSNVDSTILPPAFIPSQTNNAPAPVRKNVEGLQVDNPFPNMYEMMPSVPEFEVC
jgi:hypothetical protein